MAVGLPPAWARACAGEQGGESRLRLHDGERQEWNDLQGVTADLPKRVYEHREGLVAGFTKKYGCKNLVWFEAFDDLEEARRRERQIKELKRAWKIRLIEENNLEWHDLYPTLF